MQNVLNVTALVPFLYVTLNCVAQVSTEALWPAPSL